MSELLSSSKARLIPRGGWPPIRSYACPPHALSQRRIPAITNLTQAHLIIGEGKLGTIRIHSLSLRIPRSLRTTGRNQFPPIEISITKDFPRRRSVGIRHPAARQVMPEMPNPMGLAESTSETTMSDQGAGVTIAKTGKGALGMMETATANIAEVTAVGATIMTMITMVVARRKGTETQLAEARCHTTPRMGPHLRHQVREAEAEAKGPAPR